ncbi:hypothetical protein PLIIFM63780_009508 [Purpureocillium lilacinum]|uniref:Uncharacterized protein n=1 Tax=Purpureocillium lilacinum TaxID=33203 RepID=A0A179GHW9_PURLI|nr:hypothetical protein VFPBJ_07927 [Purpureocillium lilacinum]GJN85933.1 hypothetical protein PLIIFM63780_009508 [Purpureocillium lilacinum]
MSERPRRPELGGGAPRAARGAVKSSGMTSSSIHQQHHQQLHHSNFLRSQLTRRPTGAAASGASGASAAGGGSVASGSSAETLRVPGGGGAADVDVLSDTSEIVVRNQQGEIELGDPPTPVLEEHDEQAEDRQEAEKERQRLADAVRHHSVNHSSVPDQPEELLEAVRADLRAKVSALAEDNWMFEPEEPTRG